jgi:hypothetical protein
MRGGSYAAVLSGRGQLETDAGDAGLGIEAASAGFLSSA